MTSLPVPVLAQSPTAPPAWRFSAEAGATGGGVWLEGPRVPRVSTGLGFTFAAAARRALSDAVGAAAVFRVSTQPLDLKEHGVRWKGGTLTQFDMVALLSVRALSLTSSQASVEAGIGAAVLTGADSVMPFRNTSAVAPAGEIGVALTLGDASSGRRDVSLVARYGIVRTAADAGVGLSAGWVGRVSAGARVTR